MRTFGLFCLSIIIIFCGVKNSYGKDPQGKDHVYAIQSRIYDRYHEIGLTGGYIPDDAFYSVYPIGFNYTFNFNDKIAWEVVRGQWMVNQERDLKTDLETEFGVTPEEFDKLKYMVHTHLVLKPTYGKDAVWNRSIINHEGYIFLGGGIAGYETQYSNGNTTTEIAPSISFGLGRKYFLNKKICINLEIRDLINLKEEKTENNIYLGVSIGYRFNLSPRKTEVDSTIERLNEYLKDEKDNEK